MGSMITLGIGKFEIDWGKNNFFTDHSALFLPSDVVQMPYYYANNVVEMKEGLARKLSSVKRRLDLLGYSPKTLARKYQEHLEMVPDYYPDVPISFEQFRSTVSSIDLEKVSLDAGFGDYDLGEFVSRYVFQDPEVRQHLPPDIEIDTDLGTFFENLDPYLTLRMLAENEKNADRLVQWRYADVVEGGWVNRDEVVTPLPDSSRILVVTEGSSDSFIIERAMALLRPDIADFFYFVDMEEHYPFTGIGNLFRFCQGLSRIRIQNNVLVIFDNDASGIEKFEQLYKLNRPKNMHFCRFPDHESFSSFKTV
jgi:HEPN superfamily Toprim-like protein